MLLDSFGSNSTPDSFFDVLRAGGATVRWFGTRWTPRYLIRNHQKLVVVDEAVCMSGGFNVADAYFAPASDRHGWADIGFIVTGPPVAPMVRWFDTLATWMEAERPRFRVLRQRIMAWRDDTPGPIQWHVGGPNSRLAPWARAMVAELKPGRHVALCMAYFAPSAGILRRLARIGRSDGSATLLLPKHSDNPATTGASRALYRYLLKRGVRIAEFRPQLLHAKMVIADDVVLVGSANCDIRSLYINIELMLRVDDPAFAAACRAVQEARMAEAEEITPRRLLTMGGPLTRLRWFLSWLLVSVIDYSVTRRLNLGLKDSQD